MADDDVKQNQYKVVYRDTIWEKICWNQHKWPIIDYLLSELESLCFNMKVFIDVEETVVV